MAKFEEELEAEVRRLRAGGVTDKLRVVPYVDKRCFVPCELGYCDCYPTISKKYCIVKESKRASSLEDLRQTLVYFEERIEKIEKAIAWETKNSPSS